MECGTRQHRIHVRQEMAAVRLVDQHGPPLLVQQMDQRFEIACIPLISGVNQHGSSDGFGWQGQCAQHIDQPLSVQRSRLASIVQERQIEQHGGELPQQAGLQQAAVSIAGHQHRLPRSCDGQKCGLQQAGGTVDTEPGTLGPNAFGCLLLRFRYGTFAFKGPPDVWEFR